MGERGKREGLAIGDLKLGKQLEMKGARRREGRGQGKRRGDKRDGDRGIKGSERGEKEKSKKEAG